MFENGPQYDARLTVLLVTDYSGPPTAWDESLLT
jgi:hypothetical protein